MVTALSQGITALPSPRGVWTVFRHAVVLTTFIFGLQAEDVLRKSYQQQLSDAIAVVKGMYKVGSECHQEQALMLAWTGSGAHFEFPVYTFSFEGMFPQI